MSKALRQVPVLYMHAHAQHSAGSHFQTHDTYTCDTQQTNKLSMDSLQEGE